VAVLRGAEGVAFRVGDTGEKILRLGMPIPTVCEMAHSLAGANYVGTFI